MLLGVGGHAEDADAESNPFLLLTSVLDLPVLAGPVKQHQREDLQTWGVFNALGLAGRVVHPLDIRRGADPPDRELRNGNSTWATELTELTVQDLRQNLAQVRQFGRKLRERVIANASSYTHLFGRSVVLNIHPDQSLPREPEGLLSELEQALKVDIGHMGDDLDLSQGLPQQISKRGIYGDHGPFSVITNSIPGSNEIIISASAQCQIYRSEAINALNERIAIKDKPGNEILIVTCGLPDNYGYTCPADQAIFKLLWDAMHAGCSLLTQEPNHLRGVVIHLWNSPAFVLWGAGDLPWTLE